MFIYICIGCFIGLQLAIEMIHAIFVVLIIHKWCGANHCKFLFYIFRTIHLGNDDNLSLPSAVSSNLAMHQITNDKMEIILFMECVLLFVARAYFTFDDLSTVNHKIAYKFFVRPLFAFYYTYIDRLTHCVCLFLFLC